MIRCDEIQQFIELQADDGRDMPLLYHEHLQHCSNCQEHRRILQSILYTLDSIEIPPAPVNLTDDVMLYIEQREQEALAAPEVEEYWGLVTLNLVSDTWRTFKNLFSFEIPPILRQEAWPTALATLAVVWGLMIAPRVEAERIEDLSLEQLRSLPIVSEVDRYANQLKEQSEEAADRVIDIATDFLLKTYPMSVGENPGGEERSPSESVE